MKYIKLTQGLFSEVDDDKYEILSKHNWHTLTTKQGMKYAATFIEIDGKKHHTLMHRFLMGCSKGDGKMVDHKDRDSLNNRMSNLRFCTYRQNSTNKKPRGSSKYLGVWLHTSRVKHTTKSGDNRVYINRAWASAINHGGKQIKLGRFSNEIDAAKAYDEAAKKYHGEFANLNFKIK